MYQYLTFHTVNNTPLPIRMVYNQIMYMVISTYNQHDYLLWLSKFRYFQAFFVYEIFASVCILYIYHVSSKTLNFN